MVRRAVENMPMNCTILAIRMAEYNPGERYNIELKDCRILARRMA
jgi:hypothetical protein